MSNQISNTTSLSFEYGEEKSTSHLIMSATATMSEVVDISLISLEKNYYLNEPITYIITINNRNNTQINNPKIITDIESCEITKNKENAYATQLTYSGPAYLYMDGKFQNEIKPETENDKVVFTLTSIPEKSTALIIYKTTVTQFAPLSPNSEIKTKIYLELQETQNTLEASHEIPVAEKANLKIYKSITPQTFSRGEIVSYNITLYNYGNAKAKNVRINDTFSPIPTLTSVTIDQKEVSSTDYSYIGGTFNLPCYGSDFKIDIPEAKFKKDESTGVVSVRPSVTNIVINGIL